MNWFSDNVNLYRAERKYIRKYQPGMHFIKRFTKTDDYLQLVGIYRLFRSYEDEIIEDSYHLEISFSRNYPNTAPTVRELDGKIKRHEDFHASESGILCLEARIELYKKFAKGKNIKIFMEDLLDPFLYRHSYIEKYGVEPYESRPHFGKGVLEYWSEHFKVSSPEILAVLLRYALPSEYRPQNKCPCGSGKTLRKCHHAPRILELQVYPPHELDKELKDIENEIRKGSGLLPGKSRSPLNKSIKIPG